MPKDRVIQAPYSVGARYRCVLVIQRQGKPAATKPRGIGDQLKDKLAIGKRAVSPSLRGSGRCSSRLAGYWIRRDLVWMVIERRGRWDNDIIGVRKCKYRVMDNAAEKLPMEETDQTSVRL